MVKSANLQNIDSIQEPGVNAFWTDREFEPGFAARLLASKVEHLIVRERTGLRPDETFVARISDHPERACELTESFYLGRSFDLVEMPFSGPGDKDEVLEQFQKVAKSYSCLSARLRQIESISSELALNAVYTAAICFEDLMGKPFAFDSTKQFRLRLAFNEESCVLSCRDPIGSLDRERLLNAMIRPGASAAGNARVVQGQEIGQTGTGCVLMLGHSTDFFAISQRFLQTWIACRIPLRGAASQHASVPKSLHVVVRGSHAQS